MEIYEGYIFSIKKISKLKPRVEGGQGKEFLQK